MATPIPQNRASFSWEEIRLVCGAELVNGHSGETSGRIDGVTTDSRGDLRGKLFVALPGETFDGHHFVEQAAKNGAAAVLVQRAVSASVPVFHVSSTLSALGALGSFHRRRWGGKLIAVGGSAGKTTTRGVVSHLLEHLLPQRVHSTPGNLNNQIGAPMVLLGLTEQHSVAVLELGTNQRGEIATLGQMCGPDVAVVTLIDLEHTEGIGDLDAVEAEEGDLLANLTSAGVAVANGDDERVVRQLSRCPASRVVRYGFNAGLELQAVDFVSLGTLGSEFTVVNGGLAWGTLRTPLLGRPGALAILASLAVVVALTGELPSLAAAQTVFGSPGLAAPGRLNIHELRGGVVVVDDTYNSNPRSVSEGIAVASKIAAQRSGRLLLVLGEMRELGSLAEQAHQDMGRLAAQSGAARLFAVAGSAALSAKVAQAAGMPATFHEDADDVLEGLLQELNDGDIVLVKASRGVRAERVVNALLKARGQAA